VRTRRPWAFPQVWWGILDEPIPYIKTPKGNLLVGGWYAFARKMQYTGDIIMATTWGLACGFASPLPYFYATFFTSMIIHRQSRDEALHQAGAQHLRPFRCVLHLDFHRQAPAGRRRPVQAGVRLHSVACSG
jgi:hypothetical protein